MLVSFKESAIQLRFKKTSRGGEARPPSILMTTLLCSVETFSSPEIKYLVAQAEFSCQFVLSLCSGQGVW
jgi:hypothetical protein